MHARIIGTGHHVPARIVTNEELAPRIASTPEWIEERTGIRERRWVEPGESNSGLAEIAARHALADAGLEPKDLDAIIFATLSPDAGFPGSGVFLQRRLDVPGIPALDIRNQCSGFLYGLSIARAWLSTGMYRRILLVGSEIHSTGLDVSERGRTIAALFGDGAGACILEASDDPGVLDVRLGADGRGAEALWVEIPASHLHPNMDASYLAEGRQYPQMQGRTVFRRAVETLEREVRALIQDHGLDPNDVLFVPHQANRFINEMVAKRVGIPLDRIENTIDRFANTTAATIPITLDIARRAGRITSETRIVSAAFGSGYTWGTALYRI